MTKNGSWGRGILAFETCKPARRPGERLAAKSVVKTSTNGATSDAAKPSSVESERNSNTTNQSQTETQVPVPLTSEGKKPVKLLAKYNYKANPNRPGGFDELSLKQAERLEFVQAHPANPFWWEARNSDGQSGYVPASYLMLSTFPKCNIGDSIGYKAEKQDGQEVVVEVLEDKPSSLPWLEQKREAEQKQEEDNEKNTNPGVFGSAPPGIWKPYVSAYNNKVEKTSQQERQWYCELCDKQLNGPKPYQAHMVSRAHKDELEAQGLS